MVLRLNRISLHRIQFWILPLALGLLMTVQGTAERALQPLLSTPEPTVSAGQTAILLLSFLNPGTLPLQGVFPGQLELELRGLTNILTSSAERINSVGMYNIQPQGFGTTAYRFVMPMEFTGEVVVSAGGVPGSLVRFSVTNAVPPRRMRSWRRSPHRTLEPPEQPVQRRNPTHWAARNSVARTTWVWTRPGNSFATTFSVISRCMP